MSLRRTVRRLALSATGALGLSVCVLLCGFPMPAAAQSPEAAIQPESAIATAAPAPATSAGQQPEAQAAGSIAGTVVDQAGALAVGAHVSLSRGDQSAKQETLSGENGQFSFANLPPGPFQLTVTSSGFETKTFSGTLAPGEAVVVPAIVLGIAPAKTEVQVGVSQEEIAEEQIKEQEKARVLGFIPNFYVTYVPNAAPLVPRQKFYLAWKSVIDPITFVGVGALAGIEQAADEYSGYGQGAEGYGKRLGAAYADVFIGTFIDSAILTSVFKQDPRYFYRGKGTKSRLLYAIGNAVICKGDNGHYQPNYSAIIGSFATGGISQLYYPASDRGAGLLVQNSLIRIAEGSIAGIFQEYVVRKFTPRLKSHPPPQP